MNIDTRIKFRHLVCFLEVARQGGLARACEKLAISQPALSKTPKELESLLDARLVEHTSDAGEWTINTVKHGVVKNASGVPMAALNT